MSKTGFTPLFRAIQEVCFPSYCLGCAVSLAGCEPPLFCSVCSEEIVLIRKPLCPLCGRPYFSKAGDDSLCGTCLDSSRYFDRARAVALYHGPLVRAIHALKYSGSYAVLPTFAALFTLFSTPSHASHDLIIPVPLHPLRLKERGFNQSLLLARSFFPGQRRRIAVDLLLRHRNTVPQTGLTAIARRKNIRGAFAVTKKERVSGRSVLLVDDVYTTGTTVNECARVLKSAGALGVEVMTLARVDGLG